MKIYHKITGKLLFDGDPRGADLRWANFCDADLRYSDFSWADLRDSDFRGVCLHNTNFREADLREASFCGVDLRDSDFRGTDIRWAYFREANVQGVLWPAPTEVLLANWGVVSDDLTRELMIFDSWCHPDPTAFDRWAEGGPCPYDGVKVQRAANFKERKDLWSLGPKIPKSPLELMDRLLLERCIGHVPSCNWVKLPEGPEK